MLLTNMDNEENTKENTGDLIPDGIKSFLAGKKEYLLPASIVLASLIIAGAWLLKVPSSPEQAAAAIQKEILAFETKILPAKGVELPIGWGNLGAQLVETGTIDIDKFRALYSQQDGVGPEIEGLLRKEGNSKIVITKESAPILLNIFWALGLANKNEILDNGPMTDEKYGGNPGGFASTGGWTLAKGGAMEHYSMHRLVGLTSEQQELVERVAKNIYRPCCGNSTHFPDCNHGMAMLGLLELMASQGVSEQEMYRAALKANTLWFPNQYATIDRYLVARGSSLANANPQEILGRTYSSGSGFAQIAAAAPAEPASNRPPPGG